MPMTTGHSQSVLRAALLVGLFALSGASAGHAGAGAALTVVPDTAPPGATLTLRG